MGYAKRLAAGAGALWAAASVCAAGEISAPVEGAWSYRFTDCERPAAPDLSMDAALRGGAAQTARNAAVRRYNEHVAAVNVWLECLAGEAERDLAGVHLAVTSALNAEQDAVLSELEQARRALTGGS